MTFHKLNNTARLTSTYIKKLVTSTPEAQPFSVFFPSHQFPKVTTVLTSNSLDYFCKFLNFYKWTYSVCTLSCVVCLLSFVFMRFIYSLFIW